VALCIHETPSYQKWYDEVFSSNAPKAVEAFSAVRILTMKQIDGPQIAVMAIVPTSKIGVVRGFYDQEKNPLWAEGRQAGWLQVRLRVASWIRRHGCVLSGDGPSRVCRVSGPRRGVSTDVD
jgi:hypothetical protein